MRHHSGQNVVDSRGAATRSRNSNHKNSESSAAIAKLNVYSRKFLVFTHVMRRPCWCTKQCQDVAHVFHNNRIKFPKQFFSLLFCTPTWPPWRHVKTENTASIVQLLQIFEQNYNHFVAKHTHWHLQCWSQGRSYLERPKHRSLKRKIMRCVRHWREQPGVYIYIQRQISQLDCEISSNCGKICNPGLLWWALP